MATANLPGGAEYSGALLTSFVGFRGLKNQITLPTPPTTDINGNRLIYVNLARANIGGGRTSLGSATPTTSRSIRFEIGPYVSDYFTVPATASNANPPLTGTIGIGGLFLNPVTTDFVVKTEILDGYIRYLHLPVSNLNIFSINADNSTRGTIQTNRGLTGSYQYFYAPAAPTGLSLSSEQPTSVTLNWSAPADKGDTTITGYRVEYSVNSNFSGAQVINIDFAIGSTPPDAQSRSITGLALDRTYYFRVAAKNGVTDAAGSYSVWSGTIQKNSRPNTPSISVSRSVLTYTISGSATIGDGSIASFRFSSRSSTNGGVTFGAWSSDAIVTGTSTYSTTFSSLATRAYQFRVRAVSSTGLFGAYVESSVVQAPTPTTPTLNVSRSGLVYTISGSSSISSGSISSYGFSRRSSTDGGLTFTAWTTDTTLSGSTYNTTFTSSAATTYQFRVRAVAETGLAGSYNSSGNFHTPNVPLIPTTAISLSKNVRKVTVDWAAFRTNANSNALYNGAVISSYQVEARYSNDGGATWVISYANIANTNAATTVLITGDLLIAKTYEFRVRAVSDVGNSAYQTSSLIFISAYGQRRGDSGFLPIENAKRFDGTSWQTILMAKRFNGTSWVDLTN